MLTFSICKRFFKQKSLKLISEEISFMTASLRSSQKVPEVMKENNDVKLFEKSNIPLTDVILASKLLQEYREPETVLWEDVIKKLKDCNIQNPHTTLFQSFLRFRNVDFGVSFYNHLIKKGKQFTVLELMTFLNMLSFRKDLIKENKIVIQNIYENIKDYLMTNTAINDFVIDVITEVPYCFFDYVKTAASKQYKGTKKILLANKAFAFNRPDIALELMKGYQIFIPASFTKAYLNFLIRMSEKNELSPDMITTFVNFYGDKMFAVGTIDLLSTFKLIVQIANKHYTNYIWSVSKCSVNNDDVCSNCENELKRKSISEAELDIIKDNFLSKIALFNQSIFISTSDTELKEFLSFLSNCKPYDIVIDALNVLFKKKKNGVQNFWRVTRHLLSEGFSILIIGKKHSKNTITKAVLSRKRNIDKVQFFFSSNLSDDDVFLLYAALHGGIGTHFLTADFFSNYLARLNDEQKDIFLKWKICHQYIFNGVDLIPPRRHLGVPQLTKALEKSEKRFVWHISYSSSTSKVDCCTEINWICLQAKKKK